MESEAGRAREGTAHLNALARHDDSVLGEPKIVPPSARAVANEANERVHHKSMKVALLWWITEVFRVRLDCSLLWLTGHQRTTQAL